MPSPFDSCNTCLCGEDGSIEGCTRILCLGGTSLSVKVLILFQKQLSITRSLYIQVFKIYHTYIELERIGTKLEGETCGACFNPAVDFDCGQCVEGLECVSHPDVELIPDLPATCKAPLGNKN